MSNDLTPLETPSQSESLKEIDFSSAVLKPTFVDSCKFCKEYGLQWWQFYNGWRLMEKDGSQHKFRPRKRSS